MKGARLAVVVFAGLIVLGNRFPVVLSLNAWILILEADRALTIGPALLSRCADNERMP